MESWRTAWRVGFCPLLPRAGLEALLVALEADDPRLLQGATMSPPALQCISGWPIKAADPLAFCAWQGGIADTVGDIEEWWAQLCFDCDQALNESAGCRWALNWIDETPRGEVFRLLAAEVRLSLAVDDLLAFGVTLSRPRLYTLVDRAGVMLAVLEDEGEAEMAEACLVALGEVGADCTMSRLIEALQIFLKYGDPPYPTGCEHDTLYVYVDPAVVSAEDVLKLKHLGFSPDVSAGHFYSYRYGSA